MFLLEHIAVDIVVFAVCDDQLQVLLIQREIEPYEGGWALPGGFVHSDESIDQAASRELLEETGLECSYLEQLYTFGDVKRDPRGRVISVAYYSLVKPDKETIRADSDARDVAWYNVEFLPKLAFDHDEIIRVARDRLRGKVQYQPIGFELLPKKFTLSQLQRLYEIVLGHSLDKRNFRKKILATEIIQPLDERETNVAHRSAQLYRFDRRAYKRLCKQGFRFSMG